MRFYVIAGEASGDLHAAKVLHHLKRIDPTSEFRAWGGDLMAAEGATIVKHYRDLAFMGFAEVISNLGTILGNLKFCKQDILNYKPDALLLIDYPGFNLRIAEFAKQNGIKVFYYISPQIWAWKQNRVHQIKRCVDKMFVILPFEKEFYARFNMDVEYVGHPLLDELNQFSFSGDFRPANQLGQQPLLAILPGSRKQEIKTKLPIMQSAAQQLPNFQSIIAGAPAQTSDFYQPLLHNNAKVLFGETYNILKNSDLAFVTSGTATLETALIGTPEIVCYKGNPISYAIGKRLIKVKYISLVNLILDRPLVKELIQHELTPQNLLKESDKILKDQNYRSNLLAGYQELRDLLGGGGASERVAQGILGY